MALYVAICLVAALTALPESGDAHAHVTGIIWGVTIGLALAYWFAFRVSARLVGEGRVDAQDVRTAGAQLAGAAVVGLLATVAVVLAPESAELVAAGLILAAFLGVVGYVVASGGGASRAQAVGYAASVMIVAAAIAELKNALAGH